jgi:hypothetical protein
MSTIRVDKIMPFQSSSVEILGSFNGTYTGSFTGSFVGDGSGLTGIPGATPTDTSSLVSTASFNEFTSSYNSGSFSGSFVGDGSGLTGIVAEASIDSSSFATTGSNSFRGNQSISGSLTVSGSIRQNVGEANTFVGTGAGFANFPSLGTYNTFIGTSAGQANQQGTGNLAIGASALNQNILGDSNVAVGNEAGSQLNGFSGVNTGGTTSIFIGHNTQAQLNNQTNQIVIGHFAEGNGSNTTTIGNSNTTATYLKGKLILSGSTAQEITGSLRVTSAVSANSFTGSFTGSVNVADTKSIIYEGSHIAISGEGGVPNTSGSYVIKIGVEAGRVNQVGFNTFIGHQAGYSNTTGQNNTYLGNTAGYRNVAGGENTYVGVGTAAEAVSGSQNSIMGTYTGLYSNGNNNTFVGTRAVTSLSTGSENVVVGAYAATGSTISEYLRFLSASVIVGYGASPNNDNPINQVIIGHDAIGNGNNTVTLGNDGITNTYLKGVVSGSLFTGSFVGDGSGLTNIPTINTGSFATTGSNTFMGNQIVSASVDVSGSVTSSAFQIGTPPIYIENTAYWLYGSFTNAGAISFGFSEGNSIANIDNIYINETSSDINGAAIVNSYSWVYGLVNGDIITIQGIDSSPSNLNQTITLSVNSVTDFEDGTWNIGVSVLSYLPLVGAAAVNGSLYSLTYTTTFSSGSQYTITGDDSRLLVSSSNTEFNGFVVLSQVSSSYNFADDSAAASGGVPLGGLYHTSGSIKIRLV